MFPIASYTDAKFKSKAQKTKSQDSLNDFRQHGGESADYKYEKLRNKSNTSVDDNMSMHRSNSDVDAFYNVKNGRISHDTMSESSSGNNFNAQPLSCADLVVDMTKKTTAKVDYNANNTKPHKKDYEKLATFNYDAKKQPEQNDERKALVKRDANGNVIITTNMVVQEPNIEISYDQVRYLNIFSLLCCWCFPFTGLLAVFFSRRAKRSFSERDMPKCKKYVKKTECSLLVTFLIGFTLIAIAFALAEAYLFRNKTAGSRLYQRFPHL